ncbi:hypothetical protein BpHYR1_052269, partial [Brachionus plicatilis]
WSFIKNSLSYFPPPPPPPLLHQLDSIHLLHMKKKTSLPIKINEKIFLNFSSKFFVILEKNSLKLELKKASLRKTKEIDKLE